MSATFVKPGTPTVDLGGPSLPAPTPHDPAKPRPLDPVPRLRAASAGASVENSDPQLSAALLVAAAVPSAENHLRVAVEYRRLGILDACADQLKAALEKAPRFADAHELLARVWRDWGLPDEGLGAAYRSVYFAPKSASAQNTLGTLLSALGRLEDARTAYLAAASLDPEAAWALNNLCDVERRMGRQQEARARCEAALRLEPTMRAAHNNLALVLATAGDLAGAREHFLAAGDEASASYNLGIVHLAERDYASAATSFEQAIRERPGFTAAKERAHVTRLRILTGDK